MVTINNTIKFAIVIFNIRWKSPEKLKIVLLKIPSMRSIASNKPALGFHCFKVTYVPVLAIP